MLKKIHAGVGTMPTEKTKIIQVEGTMQDVMVSAMSLAAETQRETPIPVRIFTQGNRQMVSGVMPCKTMVRVLDHNAADKGATAAKALNATNRPYMKEHAQAFEKYLTKALEQDENFIIPPLTLNSTGGLDIFVLAANGRTNSGYAVLPDETKIHITDGQHRFNGIKQVVENTRGTPLSETIAETGVPFMMTIEADISQVHQDFADAGKTKALPPSLLAVYDIRQPANRVVIQICNEVPLLDGRVDSTSNSIGKGNEFVYLVNQIRQFVKHSLTGSTGTSEMSFEEQATAALSNKESRDSWIRSRVAFLKAMSEVVPDWNEVAQLSPPGGADAAAVLQKTKDVKVRGNVPSTGAFLTALGLVSHELLRDHANTDLSESALVADLRQILAPLNDVDWSRQGALWQDNIVTGGKIRTQAPAVRAASKTILKQLGFAEETVSEAA